MAVLEQYLILVEQYSGTILLSTFVIFISTLAIFNLAWKKQELVQTSREVEALLTVMLSWLRSVSSKVQVAVGNFGVNSNLGAD
ncbi:MAG: hypothetical protein CMK59_00860 [Proteobacteria bacterium]|nr:hypothetical protein [Pseudomonadota bacterium]